MKIISLLLLLAACGTNAVTSADDARKAYLGLDASIDKAIQLGFDGFNSASSANISPQTASGTKAGTLTVTGQVDQGTSTNKGMRLFTGYAGYSDDGLLTYQADPAALPALTMQLKNIPTGTLSGTLVGTVTMSGTYKGSLALNLVFNGMLQAGAGNTVQRQPGTTHTTGTATSTYGTYNVDVTH
ncbi:MAG TPA: hypothetical protein VF993_00925 [Myxococcales bacterium]